MRSFLFRIILFLPFLFQFSLYSMDAFMDPFYARCLASYIVSTPIGCSWEDFKECYKNIPGVFPFLVVQHARIQLAEKFEFDEKTFEAKLEGAEEGHQCEARELKDVILEKKKGLDRIYGACFTQEQILTFLEKAREQKSNMISYSFYQKNCTRG